MSEWTSVDDRLPEESDIYNSKYQMKYLYKCSSWIYPEMGTFEDGVFLDCCGAEIKGITHWMPLPEPPEKEQK